MHFGYPHPYHANLNRPMLLPQTAEYAMRAVLYLARMDTPDSIGVADVARETGVPENYLSKVLGQLVRADILQSSRGPNGGFRLAGDAGELTLERVAAVFTPPGKARCLLGSGVCGEVLACAVHELWAPIAAQLQEFLRTTTIGQLARSSSITAGGAV